MIAKAILFPSCICTLHHNNGGIMKISHQDTIYAFDKTTTPVAKAKAPCHLVFDAIDAFGGQVKTENDILDGIDFSHVNPATGPVFIEGAQKGDVLAVHIQSITLADKGCVVTAPGLGLLPDAVTSKTTICPIHDGHFTFCGVDIPTNPMIGVIGVAPAGDPIPTGTPHDHGGNMDTHDIKAGSTVYFPVFVEGALLAMGDLHAAMGDGEIGGTGIEVSGEIAVAVDVIKTFSLPCPLLKTDNELAFLASAPTIDEAIKLSAHHMHDFLVNHTPLSAEEVMMFMSLCGQARISQLVDPLLTARFCMPREELRKFGLALAF